MVFALLINKSPSVTRYDFGTLKSAGKNLLSSGRYFPDVTALTFRTLKSVSVSDWATFFPHLDVRQRPLAT